MLDFLAKLSENGQPFMLDYIRDDTVMVLVVEPGRYWEVEFFADGRVDVEVYESRGGVEDEESLAELLTDDENHIGTNEKHSHVDATLALVALSRYETGFTAHFQMWS